MSKRKRTAAKSTASSEDSRGFSISERLRESPTLYSDASGVYGLGGEVVVASRLAVPRPTKETVYPEATDEQYRSLIKQGKFPDDLQERAQTADPGGDSG